MNDTASKSRNGFVKIGKDLMARTDLHALDKLLLGYLINRIGGNGARWRQPGTRRLATAVGVSRPAILRSLERLVALKLLSVDKRNSGQVNHYVLSISTGNEMLPVNDANRSQSVTTTGNEALPPRSRNVTTTGNEALPEAVTKRYHSKNKNKKENLRKNPGAAAPQFPLCLDTEDFRKTWDLWRKHRQEIRHPLTPTQEQASLKKLAGWGLSRALAAIEHSIGSGWVGVFESRDSNNGPNTNRRTPETKAIVSLPDYSGVEVGSYIAF